MTIPGIDVANWQAVIDWPAVAASGIQFGIAKATEGTGFIDAYFGLNWASMKALGIARAAYHFARPERNAPADEAAFFLKTVGPLAPGDVLALDLETGTGDLSAWTLAWLQTVEQAVGFKPLLYSSPAFLAEHNVATSAIAAYGLWLASWQNTPPAAPAPGEFWAVWQQGSGAVPGIGGAVDLDQFAGTAAQFRAYGLPAPAPGPDYEALYRAEQAKNAALITALQTVESTAQGALS